MTTAAAQDQRFAVAIVRPDGDLVPFAAYEGGTWRRAWPQAGEDTTATAIDEVSSVWRRRGDRVPRVWRVWPASGADAMEVTVDTAEVVKAHCTTQVALRTNLPKVTLEHPLKFGVAVDDPNVSVRAIQKLDSSDPVWNPAKRAVLAAFSNLELAQLLRAGKPLPQEPAVTRLTALYRERASPTSPLYFVAEKRYEAGQAASQRRCEALTIMTGWLNPSDTGIFRLFGTKVFLTDCDAKEARTGLPLAALRASNQLFWVVQEHGYEDETYAIAAIGDSDVSYPVEVDGGAC